MNPNDQFACIVMLVVALALLFGGGAYVSRGGGVQAPPKPKHVDDIGVPKTKGPRSVR